MPGQLNEEPLEFTERPVSFRMNERRDLPLLLLIRNATFISHGQLLQRACPRKTSLLASCCNREEETEMEKVTRRGYTLEYKQEAVRLVFSGQKVSAAAKALGIVEQTLANWVKAEKAGQLRGVPSEQVSADRMEVNRLRAELARVTMERDILPPQRRRPVAGDPGLGKATAYFAKVQR